MSPCGGRVFGWPFVIWVDRPLLLSLLGTHRHERHRNKQSGPAAALTVKFTALDCPGS